MELNAEQLTIAENCLKYLLPQSQQVYGHIVLGNRVKSDPVKVFVDKWLEFRAIIVEPKYEQVGDLFKDICVFTKDEACLKEFIRSKNFNWTKYLCFAIDLCYEEALMAVASEKNLHGEKVAVCHMMKLEDISHLPTVDNSALTICSLDESHIGLINKAWKFGEGEHSTRMIRNMIANFPSCCVLDGDGKPAAWILTYSSCAMGILFTLPEHRGKGYAKALISSLAKKLHILGCPVYCFIEEENTLSYRIFQSMGFTEDPSYRATWIVFNGST